jgi:hypothetical protein
MELSGRLITFLKSSTLLFPGSGIQSIYYTRLTQFEDPCQYLLAHPSSAAQSSFIPTYDDPMTFLTLSNKFVGEGSVYFRILSFMKRSGYDSSPNEPSQPLQPLIFRSSRSNSPRTYYVSVLFWRYISDTTGYEARRVSLALRPNFLNYEQGGS